MSSSPPRESMKTIPRTIGILMIAILTLGMTEALVPSHGVSVNPPISFTFYFGGDTGSYSGFFTEAMNSHQLVQSDFFQNLEDIRYKGTIQGNLPTEKLVDSCNLSNHDVQT